MAAKYAYHSASRIFSLNVLNLDVQLRRNQYEFYSVATHNIIELGHVSPGV